MRVRALSQGSTSGVVDQVARAVVVDGLFELARTKAAIMSYIAGVLKGAIPEYYSYNLPDLDPEHSRVTVQAVVPFLVKAVSSAVGNDWMKLQLTMDDLESLTIRGLVPPFVLHPLSASAPDLSALKAELSQYFELEKSTSPPGAVASFLGIDIDQVKRYLLYAGLIYGGVLLAPVLLDVVRGAIKNKNSRR